MNSRWFRGSLLFVALLMLSSCATSSGKYVEKMLGYSSTKGRVTDFENLASHQMQHLADGIAIVVQEEGCQVTVDFGESQRKFEVKPGSIVVFGDDNDFLLEPVTVHAATPTR